MVRPRIRTIAAMAAVGVCLGATVGVVPVAARAGTPSSVSTGQPHIVAKPSTVVANDTTQLTGTGFPANRTITLKECSQQTWVVMSNPCVNKNVVQVTTNGNGRFRLAFTVKRCPPGMVPGNARTCYIGEPVIQGVDTDTLAGVVTVTVTRH